MTPGLPGPQRVLVVWCPDWPAGNQDTRRTRQTPASWPEARAFEQVTAVVEGFCPWLEVLRPGLCAISVRGPARYFGGERALARKITEALAAAGFSCRTGIADGLFAARLAAQAGPSGVIVAAGGTPAFLARHPVSALGSPELEDLLPRLGIGTLGEFAGLAAGEAANRFGTAGVAAHRLARGLAPRPLAPRPPAAALSVAVPFDPPAEQIEPVVFAAKALAQRLHDGLADRGLACVRVGVQVVCADGREITRLWRHDGLLSALAVAERVRWQLAGWQDLTGPGQDPGDAGGTGGVTAGGTGRVTAGGTGRVTAGGTGPVTLLRLVPDQLVRDEGRQLGLWGDAVISDRVARAAVRVQGMLGHGAVMRPVPSGGRSPAEQVTLVPFGDNGAPRRPDGQPWPGRIPAPSPATVYPVPLPARVTDGSGAEVTVTGRAVVSAAPARLSAGGGPPLAVIWWAGPWPVAERWWQARDASRKARFQLVTSDGRAWLAVVRGGRWLIEASYD